MELAIPLVALGGMYVISNQDKVKAADPNQQRQNMLSTKREGFTSKDSQLPNKQITPQNYPVTDQKALGNTVNKYTNPSNTAQKYHTKQAYDNLVDQHQDTTNISNIKSISGKNIQKQDFQHNNMVPFFGGQIKGLHNIDVNESLLDNTQGSGSQHIRKTEQAPLFKPQENVNWTHGMPSTADFMQSRMNPGMAINNVKPWEEEKVAPGLNLGYTNNGSGGFNSGMQARDQWQPKTVDELRTATNPKTTFDLANHEGPALSAIKNRGVMGKMEKYGPDTTFATGADRYLTTVGDEKRGTTRSEHIQKAVSRPDTTSEYYGNGKQTDYSATYAKGEFEESHKQQLGALPFSQADAQGHYSATPNNYGRDGYNLLPNNRITTNKPEKMGIVGGVMKAAVAPLLDVLRPSRKENMIGNGRPTGDPGTTVSAARIYNPADRTRTTIREMTENSKGHLNVENQRGDGYLVTKPQIDPTQRQTTSCQQIGNAGNTVGTTNSRTYNAEYNMTTNPVREQVARTRPNQGGTQIYNQAMNIHIDKRDADRDNNRMWVSSATNRESLGAENYKNMSVPQQLDQSMHSQRMRPDILKAFKNNPYTKSLTSVA